MSINTESKEHSSFWEKSGKPIGLQCVDNGEEIPYEVVDDCSQCEFCVSHDAGGTIGGQLFGSGGEFLLCEKGYWKEDT